MKETNEGRNIGQLIDGLGVFELRGVARQLGVPSPTTKKRDELIVLIEQAINNGATIKEVSPKRGRPFKKLNVLDSITDKINNEVVKLDFSNIKKTISFAQDDALPLDADEFDGIVLKYNYTIEMRDIKSGAVAKIEKTEPTERLLETGDRVNATVKIVDGKFVVSKILKINHVDVQEYESRFIDKGRAVIENTELPFGQGKAVLGRRNLFRIDRPFFETDYLYELCKYCENEKYELIILAINTSYENDIMFDSLPSNNIFMTVYGSSGEINYHKILDAVNYAENLVDRGKKVVLLTADIIEDLRALDKYFSLQEKEESEFEDATIMVASKLLKFARSYSNDCSGTMIMCYNEIDKNDKFLNSDILKISRQIN